MTAAPVRPHPAPTDLNPLGHLGHLGHIGHLDAPTPCHAGAAHEVPA